MKLFCGDCGEALPEEVYLWDLWGLGLRVSRVWGFNLLGA